MTPATSSQIGRIHRSKLIAALAVLGLALLLTISRSPSSSDAAAERMPCTAYRGANGIPNPGAALDEGEVVYDIETNTAIVDEGIVQYLLDGNDDACMANPAARRLLNESRRDTLEALRADCDLMRDIAAGEITEYRGLATHPEGARQFIQEFCQ